MHPNPSALHNIVMVLVLESYNHFKMLDLNWPPGNGFYLLG